MKKSWKLARQQQIVMRLVIVIVIIFVCLAVFLISGSDKTSNSDTGLLTASDSDASTGSIVTVTTAESASTFSNSLAENGIDEIQELIETYYAAIRTGDLDQLSLILDVVDEDVQSDVAFGTEYIEDYESIVCYTKDGLETDSYVVYAYSEIKFVNIETPAPSIDILYIMKDSVADTYYIHNGIGDTEIAEYITEVTNSEDVQALFEETNEKLKNACAADEALSLFCQSLESDENGNIIVGTTQSSE
ncbi:MAG: hypothetical protein LUE29_08695 [Lachnospiraceae bacterium]|nr:hypothetical protein [Lachnospiraceae bacterium]